MSSAQSKYLRTGLEPAPHRGKRVRFISASSRAKPARVGIKKAIPKHMPLKVPNKQYDAFLAAPLSGWGQDDFQAKNAETLQFLHALSDRHGWKKIYFAGRSMSSFTDFAPSSSAVNDDLAALESSGRFILWYPKRLVTSTLIECGYALARGIPVTIFQKDDAELPYLLTGLAKSQSSRRVQVITYSDIDDAIAKCGDLGSH